MCFNRRISRGFTLIELLLVAALLLMIAGAFTAPLMQGIKIFNRLNQVHQEEEIALFMERLTQELKNSVNFSLLPFMYSEQSLSFATFQRFSQPGNSQGELWPIHVTYEYDGDTRQIKRLEKGNAFFGSNEITTAEILVKETHSLKFAIQSVGTELPFKVIVTLEYGEGPFLKTLSKEILLPVSYAWSQ